MKLIVGNPYDYNYISLKNSKYSVGESVGPKKVEVTPTMFAVMTNPVSNFVGKFFGISDKTDWYKYHDKVAEISSWAQTKAKSSDIPKVIKIISDLLSSTPTLNEKRILDFYLQMKLDQVKKPEADHNGNTPKSVKDENTEKDKEVDQDGPSEE